MTVSISLNNLKTRDLFSQFFADLQIDGGCGEVVKIDIPGSRSSDAVRLRLTHGGIFLHRPDNERPLDSQILAKLDLDCLFGEPASPYWVTDNLMTLITGLYVDRGDRVKQVGSKGTALSSITAMRDAIVELVLGIQKAEYSFLDVELGLRGLVSFYTNDQISHNADPALCFQFQSH